MDAAGAKVWWFRTTAKTFPRGIRRALSPEIPYRCRSKHFAPTKRTSPRRSRAPLREPGGYMRSKQAFPKLIRPESASVSVYRRNLAYISSMDTRGFKLCAAAVGILPVTAGCTDRAPQEHPIILFILSDDTPRSSWGIYGGISGAVRRQRQTSPPCRRRVRAGQRVLHQLDLGGRAGRDHSRGSTAT